MFYSILYEKGMRENNQDSIVLQRMRTRIGDVILAMVCDGLGGEACGETASGYVAEEVTRWYCEELPGLLIRAGGSRAVEHSLSRTLFHAHEALRQYGLQHGIRCATTMTLLLIVGEHLLTAQIGDSAAYRIGRKITPLTQRQGEQNRVEHCLGIGRYRAPVFRRGRIRRGYSYLLLSDGLLHGIAERDLAGVLAPARIPDARTAERGLKTLSDTVLRRGGRDNMSAVFFRA